MQIITRRPRAASLTLGNPSSRYATLQINFFQWKLSLLQRPCHRGEAVRRFQAAQQCAILAQPPGSIFKTATTCPPYILFFPQVSTCTDEKARFQLPSTLFSTN